MEASQETTARSGRKFSWGRTLLVMVFGLMLVGFGTIFILVGRHAIEQRSYDMSWQESRGGFIGIGGMQGRTSSGVAHFRGMDAVRVGAGFVLWGALFALWGALIIVTVFRPSKMMASAPARPHGAALVLGIISFAMLLAVQVCFFPPWQIDGLVFWCVVVSMPVTAGLLLRAGKSKWTGTPFIVLVILVIAIPTPGISFALAMSAFGTVFCLGHLVFLFPELLLSPKTNTARPANQNAPL